MITIQDLNNIVGNKIANEAQKALIRNNFPPQIAEQMCSKFTVNAVPDNAIVIWHHPKDGKIVC
jgi:hypothetical protein